LLLVKKKGFFMFEKWSDLIREVGIKEIAKSCNVTEQAVQVWIKKERVHNKYFHNIKCRVGKAGIYLTQHDFHRFNNPIKPLEA
jgi:predicted DNA-binding protein YlxM (UPF0122 family)